MFKLPHPFFNTPEPPAPTPPVAPPVTPPAPEPTPPVVPPVVPPAPPVTPPAPDPNAPAAVMLPVEGATQDQWDAFYKAAGRPDAPEGYDLKFPEGVTVDQGYKDWATGTFHKLGLTGKQGAALAAAHQEFVTAHAAQQAAGEQKAVDTLKTELGGEQAFNGFVAEGQKAFAALALPAATMSALEGAAGTHAYLSVMAALGKKMGGEGGFITSGGGDLAPSQMTKEQANAEINKLYGDGEFMKKYNDANHTEHKAAVEKMSALFARTSSPT